MSGLPLWPDGANLIRRAREGAWGSGLEETGMGFHLAVDAIRAAHEMDLLTTPYVFDVRNAEARRIAPSVYRRSISMRADSAAGCCRRLGMLHAKRLDERR